MVVHAEGGNNCITNSGRVVGSIDLCSGNNSVTSYGGGSFLAGPVVNLGAGTFTNSGTINPGGAGVVANLNVSGGLAMTSTSVYNVDLDFKTGMADKVIVPGAAALNGTVTTNLLNLGRSEEHTSELQSLMRISSAVLCFKNKNQIQTLRLHKYTAL